MITRRDRHLVPGAVAWKILTDLHVVEPDEIDILEIATFLGCDVRIGGVSGADGRSYVSGGRGVIRVSAAIAEDTRRRFTIAHELGHVRLKHQGAYCTERDIVRQDGVDAEPDANAFAAEILMPTRMFRPRVERRRASLSLAGELADVFRTSLTATAVRLADHAENPCAVIWSKGGSVDWFMRSDRFPWFIRKDPKLSRRTLASEAFARRASVASPEEVAADAWVDGNGVPDELLEDTRWFPRLDATLTLLQTV